MTTAFQTGEAFAAAMSGKPAPPRPPHFEPIAALAIDEFLPPALKAQIEALNSRIQTLQQNRANFLAYFEAQVAQSPREFDADNTVGFPGPTLRHIDLLKDELSIRDELENLEPQISMAIAAESQKLEVKLIEARALIRGKLVKLGFHDHVEGVYDDPCMLQPIWCERHPAIVEARRLAADAHSRIAVRDIRNNNLMAIERIEAKLQAHQTKALRIN